MSATPLPRDRRFPTVAFNRRVIGHAPGVLFLNLLFCLGVFGLQVVPGLIEKGIFDSLTGDAPVAFSIPTLLAFFISAHLGRLLLFYGNGWTQWVFRYAV